MRIKESHGGEVTAITVGDDEAEAGLRKALAMGADAAVRIEHREAPVIDPMVVARLIGAWARDRGFDLVLTGVMAADDGYGVVGPALGALLGLPARHDGGRVWPSTKGDASGHPRAGGRAQGAARSAAARGAGGADRAGRAALRLDHGDPQGAEDTHRDASAPNDLGVDAVSGIELVCWPQRPPPGGRWNCWRARPRELAGQVVESGAGGDRMSRCLVLAEQRKGALAGGEPRGAGRRAAACRGRDRRGRSAWRRPAAPATELARFAARVMHVGDPRLAHYEPACWTATMAALSSPRRGRAQSSCPTPTTAWTWPAGSPRRWMAAGHGRDRDRRGRRSRRRRRGCSSVDGSRPAWRCLRRNRCADQRSPHRLRRRASAGERRRGGGGRCGGIDGRAGVRFLEYVEEASRR